MASDRIENTRVGCFGNSSRKAVRNVLEKEPKGALSVQSCSPYRNCSPHLPPNAERGPTWKVSHSSTKRRNESSMSPLSCQEKPDYIN